MRCDPPLYVVCHPLPAVRNRGYHTFLTVLPLARRRSDAGVGGL